MYLNVKFQSCRCYRAFARVNLRTSTQCHQSVLWLVTKKDSGIEASCCCLHWISRWRSSLTSATSFHLFFLCVGRKRKYLSPFKFWMCNIVNQWMILFFFSNIMLKSKVLFLWNNLFVSVLWVCVTVTDTQHQVIQVWVNIIVHKSS